MLKKLKPFIIPILIPLAVGGLAAFLTRNSMDIYSEINTPPLSPPAFLFPIVWTVLYILMGISSALVVRDYEVSPAAARDGLIYYAVSLIFNFAWTLVFFNKRYFLLAVVIIIALIVSVVKTILSYGRANKTAAYLQIPYLLWITFAAYLNIAIFFLNR